MKIDIIGKSNRLSSPKIKQIAKTVIQALSPQFSDSDLEIIFCEVEEIKELNQKYRQINNPTDVLSFPQIEISGKKPKLGSIAICEEITEKYQETTEEVLRHGILHLLGYDHEANPADWDKHAHIINEHHHD